MYILAIDTSISVLTCAVSKDDKILAEEYSDVNKTHSTGLMPMVDSILKKACLDIKDIDAFSCTVGPGSFTGLRIGVATVKAFAQAGKKACVAVDTLEALAQNGVLFEGRICPMIDARHGEVYSATFESNADEIKRITDTEAYLVSELLLNMPKVKTLFLGDGADVNEEEIKEVFKENAYFAKKGMRYNRASSIISIAFNKINEGKTISFYDLTPVYVKKTQAERNLDNKDEDLV
ncbi:MAG: tRNA (adenosine(37)-N6)-threonylcarbamoyltransferase complex dimerization subunit type 1 TsaB [Eubacteriales bacterium]